MPQTTWSEVCHCLSPRSGCFGDVILYGVCSHGLPLISPTVWAFLYKGLECSLLPVGLGQKPLSILMLTLIVGRAVWVLVSSLRPLAEVCQGLKITHLIFSTVSVTDPVWSLGRWGGGCLLNLGIRQSILSLLLLCFLQEDTSYACLEILFPPCFLYLSTAFGVPVKSRSLFLGWKTHLSFLLCKESFSVLPASS